MQRTVAEPFETGSPSPTAPYSLTVMASDIPVAEPTTPRFRRALNTQRPVASPDSRRGPRCATVMALRAATTCTQGHPAQNTVCEEDVMNASPSLTLSRNCCLFCALRTV
ncbi:hypothetical protein CGRA01v4_01655 [Colletotrichum graminicola]|nr:hypothetical protein CGRA01v4_01655 [Colletotrichum graminicola]